MLKMLKGACEQTEVEWCICFCVCLFSTFVDLLVVLVFLVMRVLCQYKKKDVHSLCFDLCASSKGGASA